jgi:hypothetical protein
LFSNPNELREKKKVFLCFREREKSGYDTYGAFDNDFIVGRKGRQNDVNTFFFLLKRRK